MRNTDTGKQSFMYYGLRYGQILLVIYRFFKGLIIHIESSFIESGYFHEPISTETINSSNYNNKLTRNLMYNSSY